eukprot:2405251-Alexandrium_andersonii.AAC.1
MFRVLSQRRRKSEACCAKGIFLGRLGVSNEFLIGAPRGLARARAVRRLPDINAWGRDFFDQMKSTRWKAHE